MLLWPQMQSTLCNQTIQKIQHMADTETFDRIVSPIPKRPEMERKGNIIFFLFFFFLTICWVGPKEKQKEKKTKKIKLEFFLWLVESICFFWRGGGVIFWDLNRRLDMCTQRSLCYFNTLVFPPLNAANYFASYTQESCKYCHP